MFRISSCASCHGDILMPGHAQPQDRIRCPLCAAEFLVQDVLPASIVAPPEAILLPRISVALPGAAGAASHRVTETAELESEPVAQRPRKKQPGVLSHLIGVVLGGAVGLSLGYLGLLRFGGPRYDFLEIADKLPPWVTAPIDLPFLKGKAEDGPPGRGLQDLLNESDAPPSRELPSAPPGPDGPSSVTPPPDSAPPFVPQSPLAPDADFPPASNPTPAHLPAAPLSPPPEPAPAAPVTPTAPMAALAPEGAAPPDQAGPVHFTAYSAEDLSLATSDMAAALRCPVCEGRGYTSAATAARDNRPAKAEPVSDRRQVCSACGGKPIVKMTPELYTRLCHLGEVVTFVSRGDTNTWGQRETVQQLLTSVGAEPRSAEAIGRLAGFQLEPTRHPSPGIALAGTVQDMSQVGGLYTMKVVLFGLPKVVTVVSWRPAQPAINVHDRVIILGSIVDNPAENLAGYEGRLDQVVWGGLPAKLPPQP